VPGSKNVLLFTMLALVDPGDEVIVPDPGYAIYASAATLAGGTPVGVPLRERNDFRLDIEELASKITPRTKLLVINSPQNPTGGVLSTRDLEQIAELAMRHDFFILTDEVYGQITYDGHHASIMTVPGMLERTVYSDGLSKAYAMCGWRLGYAVAPRELAASMETLMINTSSCAAAFTQMAAVEAFESPESEAAVERMVAQFQRRRDLVVDILREADMLISEPTGAFYCMADISRSRMHARDFAFRLLREKGVSVAPGTAFGEVAAGAVRISLASSDQDLREGVGRLAEFVSTL